ncbi:MAG: hypothetical protein LAO03_17320, partial [Acidobacteriia bacterium]|nr:hypothetical protein [Terriglobia bacterium]
LLRPAADILRRGSPASDERAFLLPRPFNPVSAAMAVSKRSSSCLKCFRCAVKPLKTSARLTMYSPSGMKFYQEILTEIEKIHGW